MAKIDTFTQRRILKFIEDHRMNSGVLPTLKDFESQGMGPKLIDQAVREKLIEQLYVTLTQGTILKGYKAKP